MVLNDTFNNTLVISWRYVLLVGETGDSGENQQPAASRGQTLSHNVVSRTPLLAGCELTTLVVIGTDCIGSCKPNYLTIMTTTVPIQIQHNTNISVIMQDKNIYI